MILHMEGFLLTFKTTNITKNKTLGLYSTYEQAFSSIRDYCVEGSLTWDGMHFVHTSGTKFEIIKLPLLSKEQALEVQQKPNR